MKKYILMVIPILMQSLVVIGAPSTKDAKATITFYDYQLEENGYSFSYTTSNGISRYERGVFIRDSNINSDDQILRVDGYYTYAGEDNKFYRVDYEADENGYRTSKPKSFISAGFGSELPISSAALASLSGN